jgi:hypothetical protein
MNLSPLSLDHLQMYAEVAAINITKTSINTNKCNYAAHHLETTNIVINITTPNERTHHDENRRSHTANRNETALSSPLM